jgi:hypothetical protein
MYECWRRGDLNTPIILVLGFKKKNENRRKAGPLAHVIIHKYYLGIFTLDMDMRN